MEFFTKGKAVRLRSQLNKYLVAAEDGESVMESYIGSSETADWFVQQVDNKPNVIRLQNCKSWKYLCASDDWLLLGETGRRVCQSSPRLRNDPKVEWEPIKDGSHVKLRTREGNFLLANGGVTPWRNSVTHNPLSRISQRNLWTVEVREVDYKSTAEMKGSTVESNVVDLGNLSRNSSSGPTISKADSFGDCYQDSFSKAGDNCWELGDEENSIVPMQTNKADPLNRNRWRILVLIISFIVKLRRLLKEAYKNQKMMKLYCYLFPSDYVFERETLVQLWMAAGYLRPHMEEYGSRYFDILLKEGLILPSENEHIQGKYVTNGGEVANGVDEGLKFKYLDLLTVVKEEHMEAKGAEPWHVSVTSTDINQSTFETLKRFNELRTLLFITNNYGSSLRQLPADLFLALPCLEALYLSGSHITELPDSIGKMSQLRYLNLSFTLIESLPETVCRLQKLQALNLEGCKRLYYLPKGFKKLINLRHLYFDVLGQLNFMPREIGALTELRTLSAFIVDVEKDCNIKELRYMNNLCGSCCIAGLENLTLQGAWEASLYYKRLSRLQLRWNEYGVKNQVSYNEAVSLLEPHPCLEELQMLHYPYSKLPWWICSKKFEQLCSITLRKCKVINLDNRLGQLPNLKCLYIIQMDTVETIVSSIHAYGSTVSFPKLEKLTIEGMLILANWTEVKFGDFPMLTEFIIKDCPKLESLPFISFLGSLKLLEIGNCAELNSLSDQKLPDQLETLMVDGCPLLIMSYSENGAGWGKIKHVPHIWFDLEEMQSVSGDGADNFING